jgi:MYXO-CTERM domain-containing protein
VDCEAPYGALFCDGQYVELDNYDDCAASFEVEAEASASVSCSQGSPAGGSPVGGLAALAGLLGLLVIRRRPGRSS